MLERMTSQGYKITPQRRILLDILQKNNKHLTAEEIAEKVKAIEPSISIATIYRNLNMLVAINVVSKLDLHNGPARYELNKGHNHHLVCLKCGEAIKLGVCPMEGKIQKLISENGFKVKNHHFEITGFCKKCQ